MRLITSYVRPFCYTQEIDVLDEAEGLHEVVCCNTDDIAQMILESCRKYNCGDVHLFGPADYLTPMTEDIYSLATKNYSLKYLNVEVN